MKTFQLATLLVVTVLLSSCASTDGVKTNAWGYNNNPNRQQPAEVEETETRPTQRINNDMWQNPLVVSGYDDMYYPSMMFNAPPRFIPVMVPWWESSRYWHYNSRRHFMFQCDPMLVYWDWYSPYYGANPFWGGAFLPTRFAWGGFTTYNPPVTRTIIEPTRTQQVRDFGPNRGTTSNPNTTRQVAPTNDGWNNRSQNYRPATTTTPSRTNERTNTDGWNTRTTTPVTTPTTSPTRTQTTSPTRTQTTSPTRTQTTSPTRTQTTSPTRTFTRESASPTPTRNSTSSPSRATSSPSRTTTTPKSSPSTTSKRTGR